MTLFLTGILLFSIVGMVSLLGLKRWELQTGVIVGASVRPRAEDFLHSKLTWIEEILPALIKECARQAIVWGRSMLHFGVARGVVWVEQSLERLLHLLRHKTQVPTRGQASVFLREVAEHKQKLLEESNGKHEIREY